jgi:hypothetical protein
LDWLQDWYRSKCNGEWEHEFGIEIETLDNPGWRVEVDVGRSLMSQSTSCDRSDSDWVRCSVKDGRFVGSGGPGNLNEILEVLRAWLECA